MKLAIIGAGNMGGAIGMGLIKSGAVDKKDLYVSDFSEKSLEKFKQAGANVFCSNTEAVKEARAVVLAVKPNVYPAVLSELAKLSGIEKKLIITIAPALK